MKKSCSLEGRTECACPSIWIHVVLCSRGQSLSHFNSPGMQVRVANPPGEIESRCSCSKLYSTDYTATHIEWPVDEDRAVGTPKFLPLNNKGYGVEHTVSFANPSSSLAWLIVKMGTQKYHYDEISLFSWDYKQAKGNSGPLRTNWVELLTYFGNAWSWKNS